jgi:excisionase family DNA binding protein
MYVKDGFFMTNNPQPTIETYTIPRVLKIKEISSEFGIPEGTIRRWVKSGKLPVITCGRSFLINCTTFSKFLEGECLPSPERPKAVAFGGSGELYAVAEPKRKSNKVVKVMPPIY